MKEQEHYFYFDEQTIKQKVTLEKAGIFGEDELWEFDKLWNYDESFYGLHTLMVQPQYWNDGFIKLVKEKSVKCLILTEKIIGAFYKSNPKKIKTLKSLDFLDYMPRLECLKINAQAPFLSIAKIIDIEEFSPIEKLSNLKYLKILEDPGSSIVVDIDFSKLPQLKEVNLQYPIENKTIYKCKKIESIDTRYYEKNSNIMKSWKNLKYFSAYCDNLESFEGLDNFDKLEIFRPEITSKFKTFEGLNSKNIRKFHIYTEAKKTPKTLEGISGLVQVRDMAINGLKKLESIGNLYQCHTLQELTFENCKIPNDISMLNSLASLEKLIFDDCKDIESLAFVKELPKLKYLSFDGNTKVVDGNLDFLKKLSDSGVEIYFSDRKHYSIKCKDLDS